MNRITRFALLLCKMTTVPKAGGAPTTETGTYCGVATAKDGVWKYVSDNASADPAPPAKK